MNNNSSCKQQQCLVERRNRCRQLQRWNKSLLVLLGVEQVCQRLFEHSTWQQSSVLTVPSSLRCFETPLQGKNRRTAFIVLVKIKCGPTFCFLSQSLAGDRWLIASRARLASRKSVQQLTVGGVLMACCEGDDELCQRPPLSNQVT
ncbi:hypothetical protein TTRE_0000470801 [Trichuris trichiura]|uniref:Uncharacterized protein n=1 Tax=Trichuris trichiura TaxID=36087 RepID=A0A077Z9S9_TRITR|nr:hypothetical protein TTRE_0000470801 [Trichuris trichiura]